jgi:hypothetical protein
VLVNEESYTILRGKYVCLLFCVGAQVLMQMHSLLQIPQVHVAHTRVGINFIFN